MTNDSKKIPRSRIQISDRCVHVGSGSRATREPQVEVLRDAGGIRAIHVTCRCGEVLRLDLDYSSKAA